MLRILVRKVLWRLAALVVGKRRARIARDARTARQVVQVVRQIGR